MAQDRLSEWLDTTRHGIPAYHRDQFERPKESTKAFRAALERRSLLRPGGAVLDLGCGAGAATGWLARAHPKTNFLGVDLNDDLVRWGRERLRGTPNLHLETGDLYDLPESYVGRFDGVVLLQTLSWLPEPEAPLQAIGRLQPRWLACSSLFYEGPVDCTIHVRDRSKRAGGAAFVETYYNVYALDSMRSLLERVGFARMEAEPFELGIDLPRPEDRGMGTYTEHLADGRRLSISGPLLMPWYFLFAVR